MAFNGLRYSVQVMKKLVARTIRTSTRPVFNHPFLVGGLVFVIFLYRSSPFLFSLLVSSSPVLVCTAVLLGTLLTFGHPQVLEIEKDENVINTEKMPSLRAVFKEEGIVLTREYPSTEIGRQKSVDKGNEGVSSLLGDVCSVSKSKQGGLSTWKSREIAFEPQCVEGVSDEYKSREVVIENVSHEEISAFEATDSVYEVLEKTFENGGSPGGSVDGHMDDHFESSSMPWTRVNGDEDEEDEDEDSGSDGAESSSLEASSLDDIIPLLGEIHPLFECENSINSSLLGNRSLSSNESSISSDEETDHKEAEEEEAEAAADEEENQANQEGAEKSAITWTEDDQKNVMDLGSSELERNRRLESLIARRTARRSVKVTNERNLIDLDGFDLPFQVPAISTARENPFDFPNDTYDDMGLPPVPGSAPSILLPRRNPFDLPYDSAEEKPDLTGDNFHQELTDEKPEEKPVFRRHESFSIGSSFFDGRDASRASRLRPYFVPERLASEGTAFSSFTRQLGEVSESPNFQRQTSELSSTSSFYRQASEISEVSDMSESKASSDAETEPVPAEERVPDSEMDHASVHVERGIPSSDIIVDQYENRDFDLHMPEIRLGGLDTRTDTDFHQDGRMENDVEEIELIVKQDEEKHDSSSSSSSSSSEDLDDVQDVDEGLTEMGDIGFNLIEKYDEQAEKLFEVSDFHEEEHISTSSSSLVSEELNSTESLKHDEAMVDMDHIMPDVYANSDDPAEHALDASNSNDTIDLDDPVYDSSPRASKNHLSISSEHLLEEFSELDNKDDKQERDDLLGKNDGDTDHGFPHEHSSSAQADLLSLATDINEKPELVGGDNLLSEDADSYAEIMVDVPGNVEEKLVSAADEAYSLQDDHLLYPRDYQEESFVIPEKLAEVNKTELQAVEPEPSEIIEKPCVENGGKSAPDDSFINTSVEIAEAGIEENKARIHILDTEPIKSIEQSNDENAKKSTPVVKTIEPEVENAEPECSENFEENSNDHQDKLIKEEIVVGSTKDVLDKEDPIVKTMGSDPGTEEPTERSKNNAANSL